MGKITKAYRASGAIGHRRLVKFTANDDEVALATSPADLIAGVSDCPGGAQNKGRVDIVLEGIAQVEAGGPITPGAAFTADANGRAVADTATGKHYVGGRSIYNMAAGDWGDVIVSPALGQGGGGSAGLSLYNNSVPVNSPAGTVFGAIQGGEPGSTFAVTPNDGRFAISTGGELVVGLSAHTQGVNDITIVETTTDGRTKSKAFRVAFRARPTADWAICTRSESVAAKQAFDTWLGAPTDMVHIFAESGNGATTWSENLAIVQADMAKWAGTGVRFDVAMPGCSTSQSLDETNAGMYDEIIRQIFAALAAGTMAATILVRALWEAESPGAYPHSGTNAAGRDAKAIAAKRRIMQIAWTVDARFIFQHITFGGAKDYLGVDVDALRTYPGNDVTDVIGTDPYVAESPLPSGTNIQRAAYNKRKLPAGLDECIALALSRGKMVSIPEHGITDDAAGPYIQSLYLRLIESGVGVTHIGYWNKGNYPADVPFACRLDNGQYPNAGAFFKRYYGPLQWATPAALTATTNNRLDMVLETNRPATYTIVGGANAAQFEITGGSAGVPAAVRALANLAAGSYAFTIRATDARGKTVDQAFTLTVANGMLAPETYNIRSRYTVAPTSNFSTALSNLIYALKGGNVLKDLDFLYLLRNGAKQAAYLNILSALDFNAVEFGGVTFTANDGVQGDGSTGRLELNVFPSMPGMKAKQDDFYYGVYALTDLANGAGRSYDFGGKGGGLWIARDPAGTVTGRPGVAATKTVAPAASYPGLVGVTRTGPAAWASYQGGQQRFTGTDQSAVPPHYSLEALAGVASDNQFGVNKLAAIVGGRGLSLAKHTAIANGLDAFVAATLT